jgi:hypothetical protein
MCMMIDGLPSLMSLLLKCAMAELQAYIFPTAAAGCLHSLNVSIHRRCAAAYGAAAYAPAPYAAAP